jgi:hypothetical protein
MVKRYQSGKQKPYTKEQTVQWSKDTKVVNKSRKASVYHFGIFWPLYCLFFGLRLLFTTLVSFDHCTVCSLVYGFCLPLWYLRTDSTMVKRYQSGKQKPYTEEQTVQWSKDTKVVNRSRVSFDHCTVCSLVYGFCLPLWYLLTIVLSVLWFTASVYHFGIFWPLYCLFFGLRLRKPKNRQYNGQKIPKW